jgi:hypothetical protein
MSDAVRAGTTNGVNAITLERPDTGNALSDPAIVRLSDLLETANPAAQVITIRGAGADFCVEREPPPASHATRWSRSNCAAPITSCSGFTA